MKRLLIAVVAVAGLLGSVMAVAVSVTSSASAQTAIPTQAVTLNSAAPAATGGANNDITVTIMPLAGCTNAGGQFVGGAADTAGTGRVYTLRPSQTQPVGTLSLLCNWLVTYSSVAGICHVSAQPRTALGATGDDIGPAISTGVPGFRGLALSGNGVTLTTPTGTGTVTGIVFNLLSGSQNCADLHDDSEVSITVPRGPAGQVNYYANLQFPVEITPTATSHARCTQERRVTLTTNGLTATSDSTTVMMTVSDLIEQPLGVTTGSCEYTVGFPGESGALSLNTRAPGHDALIKAGEAADLNASATYAKTVVNVVVTSEYDEDEAFLTTESVDYHVTVAAPCGGYIQAIPTQFGVLSDVATVLPLAGRVVVYGPSLSPITSAGKTFTVDAYADPQGTQECTVTVTEKNGPARCTVMGGNSDTKTYETGNPASFTFLFDHDCDDSATTTIGGDNGDSIDSGDGGPPVPTLPEGLVPNGPAKPEFTG